MNGQKMGYYVGRHPLSCVYPSLAGHEIARLTLDIGAKKFRFQVTRYNTDGSKCLDRYFSDVPRWMMQSLSHQLYQYWDAPSIIADERGIIATYIRKSSGKCDFLFGEEQ